MINLFFDTTGYNVLSLIGVLVAFFGTFALTAILKDKLPRDHGREFAHDGVLSAGKPRGAGIIFILTFVATGLIFGLLDREMIIYFILLTAAMVTGFLDDAAKVSWGELKKGLLDLAIAVLTALTMFNFNGSDIKLALLGINIHLNPILYIVLAIALIWWSINVTNCADGVDGLSATLSIISLGTIYIIMKMFGQPFRYQYLIILFIACIMGYLWFNATPSVLMMGDGGSRAIGLFIAIMIMKTGSPVLYLLVAAVLMVDGGIGLIKVSLLRYLKIKILTKVRTPLHDHVRKNMKWSNAQTVFKFAIIQIVISTILIWLLA